MEDDNIEEVTETKEAEVEEVSSTSPPESLTKARKMGWVPKEEFRGDKTKWVDAGEYVRRGEQIIPIINANLRRVESENEELRGELRKMQNTLSAATESIEALKELNTKDNITDAKDARRQLIVQRSTAVKEDNEDLVIELDEKIADATVTIRDAETALKNKPTKEVKVENTPDPTATPEFRSWKSENPWYGADEERSSYAGFVITQMAKTGEVKNFKGQAAILEEVTKRVFKVLGNPEADTRRSSKVEGSGNSGKNNGGGGSSSGDKTFNELPADVKAAATRMSKKLVGPKGSGRAFTDIKTYQAHYAKKYFEDNSNE